MSIIFNPKTVLTLTTDVLLHPSQLNNDLYDNLKSNLSIRLLNHCYKDYGYISKIYNIISYSQGRIFNEDIISKVQYKVKFNCEVIKPISGLSIIVQLSSINNCISAITQGMNIFIDNNQLSDKFFINQNNNLIYKPNGYILKKGDLVKIKILQYIIYHYGEKITVLGYLEDILTEQEIDNYYKNKYETEIEDKQKEFDIFSDTYQIQPTQQLPQQPKQQYNTSRLSPQKSIIKTIEKKYFSVQSATNLSTFETKEDLPLQINRSVTNTDISVFCDFINFLTPFSKMKNINCICIKPYINKEIVQAVKILYPNINFNFYKTIPYIEPKNQIPQTQTPTPQNLLISDLNLTTEYINSINPIKVDLAINLADLFSDNQDNINQKSTKSDIIILPYTNSLRLYLQPQTLSTPQNPTTQQTKIAYINYFNNFNDPTKLYDKYYKLFLKEEIEPTYNNIIVYKLLRYYYNNNQKTKENKEKTVERLSKILSLFNQ